MNAQSRLLVALALGALVATTQITACSGGDEETPDAGSTPDGGSKPDAGNKPDGGNKPDAGETPDAGEEPEDHTIGGPCTGPGNLEQGDCDTGLSCIPASASLGDLSFPGGVCTKACTTDADCGTHDGSPNQCRDFGGDKLCMRGCDPLVTNTCGRGSYTCTTEGSDQFCFPSCLAVPALCAEGTSCDAATGLCKAPAPYDACPTGVCGAGAECLSLNNDPNPICLEECTSTACPSGFTCSVSGGGRKFCTKNCGGLTGGQCPPTAPTCATITGTTKGCVPAGEAGTQGSYEQCGGEFGNCVDGAGCAAASASSTSGICLVDCTTNAGACPGGTQCVSTPSSAKVCAMPCTAGTTVCPTGSTCAGGLCQPS